MFGTFCAPGPLRRPFKITKRQAARSSTKATAHRTQQARRAMLRRLDAWVVSMEAASSEPAHVGIANQRAGSSSSSPCLEKSQSWQNVTTPWCEMEYADYADAKPVLAAQQIDYRLSEQLDANMMEVCTELSSRMQPDNGAAEWARQKRQPAVSRCPQGVEQTGLEGGQTRELRQPDGRRTGTANFWDCLTSGAGVGCCAVEENLREENIENCILTGDAVRSARSVRGVVLTGRWHPAFSKHGANTATTLATAPASHQR